MGGLVSDGISREDLTAAIADHLALRQRNAALEDAMPLRDYLPHDYVRVDEPTFSGNVAPIRQWFDLEDEGGLDWAA
jgi:hypothetical protein